MINAAVPHLPVSDRWNDRAAFPQTDVYGAMAEALAAYLRAQTFCKYAWEAPDTKFQLCNVMFEWPEPSQELEYPAASIRQTAALDMLAHNFVPTPLERTWNVYKPSTVLWKLHEASAVFQVDFWVESAADREAIALTLPAIFAPGQNRSNIIVLASDRYFRAPIKLYLEGYQRMDTSESVFNKERRLLASIRADADVLDLRHSTELCPQIKTYFTQDGIYENSI